MIGTKRVTNPGPVPMEAPGRAVCVGTKAQMMEIILHPTLELKIKVFVIFLYVY